MAALLGPIVVRILGNTGTEFASRKFEHEALIERMEVVEHLLEVGIKGLRDRHVLVNAILITFVLPFGAEHSMEDCHSLGEGSVYEIDSVVDDDVEDEELVLDRGPLVVKELRVENIPFGTKRAEEFSVSRIRLPGPMFSIIDVRPTSLEEALVALGINDTACAILFLLSYVAQLLHHRDARDEDGVLLRSSREEIAVFIKCFHRSILH